LGVLNLYGNNSSIRKTDFQQKWRFSRNLPHITHGIHKAARKTNKDGKIYANDQVSDGCEYISKDTFEIISTKMMVPAKIFVLRGNALQNSHVLPQYLQELSEAINKDVYIRHYSWNSFSQKCYRDIISWNQMWSGLNQSDSAKSFNAIFKKPIDQVTQADFDAKVKEIEDRNLGAPVFVESEPKWMKKENLKFSDYLFEPWSVVFKSPEVKSEGAVNGQV
jgi:hypothetical protein